MNGRSCRGLFASLVCAGLAALAWAAGPSEPAEPAAGLPLPAPPSQRIDRALAGWPLSEFALTDHRGRRWANEELHGRWTFLLIGDTQCGDPCRAALDALTGVYRRLGGTAKLPQVLFVSLAPQRDTAEVLAAYLEGFDRRFIGATGSPQALAALLDELSSPLGIVDAEEAPAVGRYPGSLYLVGPDAALRGEYLPPFDVRALAAAYLRMRLRG